MSKRTLGILIFTIFVLMTFSEMYVGYMLAGWLVAILALPFMMLFWLIAWVGIIAILGVEL